MPQLRQDGRKRRLTLSLEKATAAFLKRYCLETHASSISACVEELIRTYRSNLEMKAISVQMSAYYDSITPQEQAEEAAWGTVGEAALAGSETEEAVQLASAER